LATLVRLPYVGMDDYGQRKLFREICEHIKERREQGCVADFVFLTGDLANRGLAPEYSEFYESFLSPMLEALGPSWAGSILGVPGNHDVDRERAPHFNPQEVLTTPKYTFDVSQQGRRAREQFALRFENYSDKDLSGQGGWLDSEAATFSLKLEVRKCNVGVVGVNSAWLCKDDDDRHRLSPGVDLLDEALGKIGDARLKIVLGHHPLGWMFDEHAERIASILGKHSALYLHGHLHANEARYDEGAHGTFLAIRCGSAFQGRSDDNPRWVNGMMWGEANLETNSVELEPLHWSPNHREWKLTTDAFPNKYNAHGKWAFPLPGATPKPATPISTVTITLPSKGNGASTAAGVPPGWEIVDKKFLEDRMGQETRQRLLQFFDGRPP
jgi:hypothetical protein